MLRDRLSLDEFHSQEWFALVGNASIEQFRNVWVIKCGEYLAFASKSLNHLALGNGLADDLKGYVLFKFTVGPVSKVDRTHPANSQARQDLIVAHLLAGGDRHGP